jgi:hypothetical protein
MLGVVGHRFGKAWRRPAGHAHGAQYCCASATKPVAAGEQHGHLFGLSVMDTEPRL